MTDYIHYSAAENRTTIPGILISGHYEQKFGYKVKRSRGTKDYYLTFTLSGSGTFYNGEKTVRCGEGDVTLITPGTPHYYATSEDSEWEFYWCHFVPDEQWASLLQLPEAAKGIKLAQVECVNIRSRLVRAFSKLLEYNTESDFFSERLSSNSLEEILLLISKSSATELRNFDSRVEKAISFISQQFKQPITVSRLAAQVNLSPSRFAHLFKEQTGEAIMEMLIKVRLKHAKRMLDLTSLSVSEIAAESGYSNPYYFIRQFAAFYGCPPGVYRKQKMNQQALEH